MAGDEEGARSTWFWTARLASQSSTPLACAIRHSPKPGRSTDVAVRDFTDKAGRRWRAWDISPDAIHPQTKAEDYLADCFQLGWIVFETFDGSDKRRLCPYPKGWDSFTDDQLVALLGKAERVPLSKLTRARIARGDTPTPGSLPAWQPQAEEQQAILPSSDEEAPDVTDLRVSRSFRYPGGSVWSCSVVRPDS